MTVHRLIVAVAALTLVGECVESTFSLARTSALPHGLRTDDVAQRAATTASHIEVWLYTYSPPKLKFYAGPDVVLSRAGGEYRNIDVGFSVEFNGVESAFRRVALPNVVVVEDIAADPDREGRAR